MDVSATDRASGAARCAVEVTVAMIGGKWKPIILFHLFQGGVLRFSELRRKLPKVSERILARQLRELEADRLVRRTVHPQVPPKVEYELTGDGHSLVPILQAMSDWGYARQGRGRPATAPAV